MGLAEQVIAQAVASPAGIAVTQAFRDLVKRMDGLSREMAQLREADHGVIAWDQHETIAVPAGKTLLANILQQTGRIAVAATVINAPDGCKVGINGSTPIPAFDGDAFENARISTLRIDNTDGASLAEVVVFLAVRKAIV